MVDMVQSCLFIFFQLIWFCSYFFFLKSVFFCQVTK